MSPLKFLMNSKMPNKLLMMVISKNMNINSKKLKNHLNKKNKN